MSDEEPFPGEANFGDETGDWMALGYGLLDGLRRVRPRPGRYKSAEANPYYYAPVFALGYLLKIIGALVGVGFATGVVPV